MSKGIIHACVNGQGEFSKYAYFFHSDQYSRFDWSKDRAEDGYPITNKAWHMPEGFFESIDASLDGEEKYEGKTYFFKKNRYIRYDWEQDKIDDGYPANLDSWNLPIEFSNGIDTAINGQDKYSGKAYFFKDDLYTRYDWIKEKIDDGYENSKPLSLWGFPAPFSLGIDAVLDGQGKNTGITYFFKGNQYLRYNWKSESVEWVKEITPNWLLLAVIIKTGVAKTKAFDWLWIIKPQLKAYKTLLTTGQPYPHDLSLMETALDIHFHITNVMSSSDRLKYINIVDENFDKIETALHNSSKSFRGRTLSEAIMDGGVENNIPFPAYTFFNNSINFTETFLNYGPLCQAAMLLHENVHYIDKAADKKNDIYEHRNEYKSIPPDKAVHNPSSYVSFSQHIYYGKDERYGAGRPLE